MTTKALASVALLTALASPALAQMSNPAESSGFPGDMGRPMHGGLMPLPPPPARRPPLVVPPGPSIAAALLAAETAVAACTGFHVAVTVIDSSAVPKLAYTPDGSAGWHTYMAFRKAYTALTFQRPNEEVAAMAKSDKSIADRVEADRNMVVWAGGVPLMAGGKVIGAIGVSGAEPSSKDEACAKAGIAKVQDQLG